MRPIGLMHPTDQNPTPPDTITSLLLVANTAQAVDIPTGAKMATFSARSSDGSTVPLMPMYVNFFSTFAAIPSSGTTSATNTSAGSTGVSVPVFMPRTFQLPGSTGLSVVAPLACWAHIEWYGK